MALEPPFDIYFASIILLSMITITLKQVPESIHAALKERAVKHGRSLNKEALACLEAAVRPRRVDVEILLSEIRHHRAQLPGQLDDDLLAQARHIGRP